MGLRRPKGCREYLVSVLCALMGSVEASLGESSEEEESGGELESWNERRERELSFVLGEREGAGEPENPRTRERE